MPRSCRYVDVSCLSNCPAPAAPIADRSGQIRGSTSSIGGTAAATVQSFVSGGGGLLVASQTWYYGESGHPINEVLNKMVRLCWLCWTCMDAATGTAAAVNCKPTSAADVCRRLHTPLSILVPSGFPPSSLPTQGFLVSSDGAQADTTPDATTPPSQWGNIDNRVACLDQGCRGTLGSACMMLTSSAVNTQKWAINKAKPYADSGASFMAALGLVRLGGKPCVPNLVCQAGRKWA